MLTIYQFWIIEIVLVAVMALMGFLIFFTLLKYKFKVTIVHLRGVDSYDEIKTRGKSIRLKNNTIEAFRLFKMRYKNYIIDPIPLDCISVKNGIKLVEIEKNHLVPFKMNFDRKAISKYNTELNLGTSLQRLEAERESAVQAFGVMGVLEKWLPIIQLIGLAVILIGGLLLLGDIQLKAIREGGGMVSAQMQVISEYNGNLDEIIRYCMERGGTVQETPESVIPPPV